VLWVPSKLPLRLRAVDQTLEPVPRRGHVGNSRVVFLDDISGWGGSERVIVSGDVVDGVSFQLGLVRAEHSMGGVARVDVAGRDKREGEVSLA